MQFVPDVMKEVVRLLSFRQLVTMPYQPICNGLMENINATLKQMLKVCLEQSEQWDHCINTLLFAYRRFHMQVQSFQHLNRCMEGQLEGLCRY